VSFAAITFCVASHRVCIAAAVYFVMDSVRKLLGIPSYVDWIHLAEDRGQLRAVVNTAMNLRAP
jgi:hypothetical protein